MYCPSHHSSQCSDSLLQSDCLDIGTYFLHQSPRILEGMALFLRSWKYTVQRSKGKREPSFVDGEKLQIFMTIFSILKSLWFYKKQSYTQFNHILFFPCPSPISLGKVEL